MYLGVLTPSKTPRTPSNMLVSPSKITKDVFSGGTRGFGGFLGVHSVPQKYLTIFFLPPVVPYLPQVFPQLTTNVP